MAWYLQINGIRARAAGSLQETVWDNDVINVVVIDAGSPLIEDEWLKDSVLLSLRTLDHFTCTLHSHAG